jgi:beta-lactamase class A
MSITRRHFAQGACTAAAAAAAAVLAGTGLLAIPARVRAASAGDGGGGGGGGGFAEKLAGDFTKIERESGGRLGVAVLDTQSGARTGHRSDERFPMCSTFKLLAAATVLSRVDAGKERLDRRIRFEAGDLETYSPVTKNRVGGDGMTLSELCDAAVTLSDNTAANLLLASFGGPAGLTSYARSIGDAVTRLDRNEPTLNEAVPGDPRDTTTPAAMLANIRTLLLGTALSAASRDQLTRWLVACKTGDARLRAGLPSGWRVGDKTGSGRRGTANDVGIAWPPGRAPIIITSYLTEASTTDAQQSATLAAVARAVAAALKG